MFLSQIYKTEDGALVDDDGCVYSAVFTTYEGASAYAATLKGWQVVVQVRDGERVLFAV